MSQRFPIGGWQNRWRDFQTLTNHHRVKKKLPKVLVYRYQMTFPVKTEERSSVVEIPCHRVTKSMERFSEVDHHRKEDLFRYQITFPVKTEERSSVAVIPRTFSLRRRLNQTSRVRISDCLELSIFALCPKACRILCDSSASVLRKAPEIVGPEV